MIGVKFTNEDIWLTQNQIAEIYKTMQQNISQHINSIYKDKELLQRIGITNFKGAYVTIDDVKITKNYLSEIELQRLNLLISQCLDFAEVQALEQRSMKMEDRVRELDNQILMNRRKILEGNGKISHEEAIVKAEKEFNIYREREMKELKSDFDLMLKELKENNN